MMDVGVNVAVFPRVNVDADNKVQQEVFDVVYDNVYNITFNAVGNNVRLMVHEYGILSR